MSITVAFAAGEGDAPLTHECAVAVRELAYGVVHAGDVRGVADLLLARARACGGYVLAYGAREEEGLLQYQSDVAPEVVPAYEADVAPAYRDGALPLAEVVEPVEQVHQRALA